MEINLPLEIIVKIGTKNEINFKDSVCRVTIKEKAENNKANIEIIKYFSKLIGRRVRIINGLKSKRKVIDYVK
ncbi:MAG: DUF167 domain-containing protein [Nanoarchaeota archaeon]|nr:DUF167 domain-containing protein [Nanoarchaeota archaeon]